MERVILVAIAKNQGVLKMFVTGRTRFRLKLWTSKGESVHYQTVCGGYGYDKIDQALENFLSDRKINRACYRTSTLVGQILTQVGGYAADDIGEILEF